MISATYGPLAMAPATPHQSIRPPLGRSPPQQRAVVRRSVFGRGGLGRTPPRQGPRRASLDVSCAPAGARRHWKTKLEVTDAGRPERLVPDVRGAIGFTTGWHRPVRTRRPGN